MRLSEAMKKGFEGMEHITGTYSVTKIDKIEDDYASSVSDTVGCCAVGAVRITWCKEHDIDCYADVPGLSDILNFYGIPELEADFVRNTIVKKNDNHAPIEDLIELCDFFQDYYKWVESCKFMTPHVESSKMGGTYVTKDGEEHATPELTDVKSATVMVCPHPEYAFYARMSADGFLDCTDWTQHDTRLDAMKYLYETYGEEA